MKKCPSCGTQYPDDANFCPTDAARLQPDVGTTLPGGAAPVAAASSSLLGGRFELGERIGGNRTGDVYEATDRGAAGARCVVKIVHEAVFPTPLLRQRTERELKQLERLQTATVVRVLAHGKHSDGRLWLAMEHFDGRPLSAVVADGGRLALERARAVMLAVGDALSEAAKLGVIHRDVAAKNVLIGGDVAKMINFSLPVPINDTVQGVPEFLSPEQIQGKPVDQRSNIYSLGALLYFALTGSHPYEGTADEVIERHMQGNPEPPSQRAPVPPAIEAALLRAMEVTSSKRFMTLRQMHEEIERADSAKAKAVQAADVAASSKKTIMGGFSVDMLGPAAQAGAAPDGGASAGSAPAPQSSAPAPAPPSPAPAPAPAARAGAGPGPKPVQPAPAAPAAAAEPALPNATTSAGQPGRAAAGKRKTGEEPKVPSKDNSKRGGFRETLWFKKGELDAAAAEAAAAKKSKDELAADKADLIPMEDRYSDDGSITSGDKKAFSLRTGNTQTMKAVTEEDLASEMSDDELVGEMRARNKAIAIGIAVVVAVGGALAAVLL